MSTAVQVSSNCFPITQLPRKTYFQYDGFTPEIPIAAKRERAMDRLQVSVAPHLFNPRAVYDGKHILYISHLSLGGGSTFNIYLGDSSNPPLSPPTSGPSRGWVKISLSRTSGADITPSILNDLVTGKQGATNPLAATAVNLLQLIIRQMSNQNYPTHKPRAFYFQEGRREVPECAIELWRGFFQSVRPTMFGMMVNIDTTMTAVYKSGPMIDIAMTLLSLRNVADLRLTEREASFHKLKEYFVGRRVTTETTGQKTKTIYGLVSAPVGRIKFSLKDGREMTIEEYYGRAHSRQLRYGSLFGVRLSPVEVTDAIIVPPEICSLKPGQFYRKKLTSIATRTAVAFATQRPGDRMKTISQGVAVNNGVVRSPLQGYGQSPYVLDAQMSISTAAVEISATLFKAPKLESQSAQITPTNGSWNILGHKFKKAEILNSWVLINYDAHHIRERDIQATAEALIKACVKLGMKVNPEPLVRIGNPQNPEEVLDAVYAYAYSIKRQIDLIVVLLPSKAEEIRYRVKHWGDTKYGIRTSCLREEKLMPNLRRPDDNQYLNNVAIKLNARLGGHYVLPITTCLERIKQEPFMVLGADVAHPGPGTNRPSIASLVFSWDRDATKYIALTDIQAPRLEMIENLQSLMKEALGVYFEKNKSLKRIIFYRDGVSEAEMDTVKSFEIAAVKAACKELWGERGFNPKDLPQLTFMVVVKRHHVIFVPKPNSDAVLDRKTGNCVAGLVVDRLRSPFSGGRDFFLQSHGAIQGTSRPGHYTVLEDECFGYNMPFIQQLSFELCHVYAKATRSVSIPAPVYYADLVCGRAKFHFDPNAGVDFDAVSYTSGAAEIDISVWRSKFKRVAQFWSYDKTMYFL